MYSNMYNRDEIFGRLGVDLLERGANPNINDERGFSPILEAVGSINENNDAILELMLQYGLDLNKMEGDKTLKERLESFNEDEMNKIIQKYYKGV